MRQIGFYLSYAALNLRRGGTWTSLAIFAIAAGVATVVALRSLGLAIEDSLIDNVRRSNHGDITLVQGGDNGPFAFSFNGDDDRNFFPANTVRQVTNWVSERNGQLTTYIFTSNLQITALEFEDAGRPQFISSFIIDPDAFPPTGNLRALDPEGALLGDLFDSPNDVVISKNLADAQGIAVGDTVRVSNNTELFTVRGIVATETEANLRDPFSAFFGFAYFNTTATEPLQVDPGPNRISIILPEGTDIAAAGEELDNMLRRVQVRTVPELIEQNQDIADMVGSFIVILGLGALLIGGVGIMNTMLVLIRRRTMEIATLKTFGLKGRQVAGLFVTEALLLGLLGSALGVIIGFLLGGLVNQFGEAFVQQPLVWRIHPEVALFGAALGLTITIIFGVLPVLTATKIRPAIILRPNETHLVKTGILHSVAALFIVILVIGLIAGNILTPAFRVVTNEGGSSAPSPFLIGIVGVAATLLIIGVLIGLLWILVWILGRFPAFGVIDLRLALRNLTTARLRTATTLLALSVGMFALSSIVFWGSGLRDILRLTLVENLGGNVMAFPIVPDERLSGALLDQALADLEGVEYTTRFLNYERVALRELDGEPISFLDGDPNILVRESDNPQLSSGTLLAGRDLTADDRGKNVAVLALMDELLGAGVRVGSTITVRSEAGRFDFEVVGLVAHEEPSFGEIHLPPETLGSSEIDFQFAVLQVEEEHLNDVLLELSSVPLVFALDVGFIDGLLTRLIEQLSALPTLVGLLSLGAAAVIMANTVSLATLERRQQIGVLKAIGLKGRRILVVMLIENTLIGLVGAVLGIGISVLGVSLMTKFGLNQVIPVPSGASLTGIGLTIAAVLIAWTATFLSARVALGERVLNVLRYE